LIISLKKIDLKFNKEFIIKTKIIKSMSILSEKKKEFYMKFASYGDERGGLLIFGAN